MLFWLVFFSIILISKEEVVQTGLYFVSVNENEELVLFGMDIKFGNFTERCNFGKDYTGPYKKYKDYINLRTGTGMVQYYVNSYSVFFHDSLDNYQSGDILACNLENNQVTKVGHLDLSCELLNGVTPFFSCASTMNDTKFYNVKNSAASEGMEEPYHSIPGKGSTLFYDGGQDDYWCYLFKNKEEDDEKYFFNADLDTKLTWPYELQNITKLYTFDQLWNTGLIGVIEYEDTTTTTRKAIVGLEIKSGYQQWVVWDKPFGKQDLVNEASDISTNVFANCCHPKIVFLKIYDENKKAMLLRYDWGKGEDSIVDTSVIGDLTYMSQMVCLEEC